MSSCLLIDINKLKVCSQIRSNYVLVALIRRQPMYDPSWLYTALLNCLDAPHMNHNESPRDKPHMEAQLVLTILLVRTAYRMYIEPGRQFLIHISCAHLSRSRNLIFEHTLIFVQTD